MADSIREKILANVQLTLQEVTGIQRVVRGSVNPFEIDPLPAISIIEINEDLIEPHMYPYGLWELTVLLRLWIKAEMARSQKLNVMIADVKNKMLEDNTRGGNAIDTLPMTNRNTYLEAEGAIEAGADLEYRITYRTLLKNVYLAS